MFVLQKQRKPSRVHVPDSSSFTQKCSIIDRKKRIIFIYMVAQNLVRVVILSTSTGDIISVEGVVSNGKN